MKKGCIVLTDARLKIKNSKNIFGGETVTGIIKDDSKNRMNRYIDKGLRD